MRLSELTTGEKGVIVKVLGHGGFRKRIVEMGFIKGKTVEVLLNAPLKDPIKYKVLGYEISLRRQEAEMIEVVSEEEAKKQAGETIYHEGLPEDVSVKEEDMKRLALGKRRTINVALVGNPNSGKTSLFNLASGAHEHVGNYSGVTVDAKEGHFDFEGYHFRIVDLPGTYSLSAYTPEEIYVRRHIIDETPDVIINVVDSSNLERNLYLTTQLIDMNVRMVVALNIYDELESSGNTLDYHLLSKLFGVPMLPTVSKKNRGLDTLFHVVINLYEGVDFFDKQGNMNPEVLKDLTEWHDSLEDRKNHEEEHLEDYVREHKRTGRVFRHIHINHGPDLEKAIEAVKEEVSKNEFIRHKYSTRFLSIKLLENDPDIESFVRTLPNAEEILRIRDKMAKRVQDTMNEDCESAITDAKYGFISGALKETFTDNHLEQAQTTKVLDSIVTHRIWGYPIFFLFMYLMFEGTFVLGEYPMMGIEWLVEQIGDLIRNNMTDGPLKDMLVDGIVGGVGGVIVFAAFIMDKIMHKMGLHGKSFIPLIMGFGCNVPAIMASRTIENRKSRLITMLINPLMSCSARLPIYLLLVGAFFPNNASLVLLSIYAIGIFLAVLLARLFSKFLVKGDDTPFVMELPPYRMPTAKSIFRHTVIIWFLGYYPNHDAYETVAEQQENSYIGQLGRAIEPVIEPMGFDWKLGIGLISGVGAKELVVSTLGVLYVDDPDADSVSLAERIPITPLVAFCYMLFVLIYFPCIAALAAIKQESGSWKWALFAACYTTVLAWLVSFAVYQIGGLFV
ncbi:MAG: fused ferrous iron transport protein A/B [Bacteroides caccae]|nr:fused ferrous iron transport protein A/B [Bacteroides caccae]